MKYKKIKTLKQYNEYCDIHEKLFRENENLHKDEIELLELLIADYDDRKWRNDLPSPNPVELLKIILKENEITQSQLAEELEVSRQLISDILNFRRNISKELAAKLAINFAMRLEAFAQPYDLDENREKLVSEKKSKKFYSVSFKKKTTRVASEPRSSYQTKKKSKTKKVP